MVLADELEEIIYLAAKHLVKERTAMEDKRDEGEDYNPTDLLRLRMMEADFEQKAREARDHRVRDAQPTQRGHAPPQGRRPQQQHREDEDGGDRRDFPEAHVAGYRERVSDEGPGMPGAGPPPWTAPETGGRPHTPRTGPNPRRRPPPSPGRWARAGADPEGGRPSL